MFVCLFEAILSFARSDTNPFLLPNCDFALPAVMGKALKGGVEKPNNKAKATAKAAPKASTAVVKPPPKFKADWGFKF